MYLCAEPTLSGVHWGRHFYFMWHPWFSRPKRHLDPTGLFYSQNSWSCSLCIVILQGVFMPIGSTSSGFAGTDMMITSKVLLEFSLWSFLCNCINIFPALQSSKKQGMLSDLAARRQANAKDRDTIPPSPPRSNTHGPCSAPARWHSEVHHQPGSFEPFTCITILYSAQFQLRKSVAIQFVALFFSYSGDLIRIINRMT